MNIFLKKEGIYQSNVQFFFSKDYIFHQNYTSSFLFLVKKKIYQSKEREFFRFDECENNDVPKQRENCRRTERMKEI